MLLATAAQATPAGRPNVLYIVADDLGMNDLGVHGNPAVKTPRIDALFKRGTELDRLYVNSTCRPTRAALMTGIHPARLGFAPDGFGIPEDVPTLPRRFSDEGYQTAHFGKWHLGYLDTQVRPIGVGYQHFFGFLDQGFLKGPQTREPTYRRPPTYLDPWLMEDEQPPRQFKGHVDDIVAEKAADFIKAHNHGAPWLASVWFFAPHNPAEAHPRYIAANATQQERYLALLNELDDNVGILLDALQSSGQRDTTTIVFVSDNGGTNQRMDNNAPYSGTKAQYLEGGIHTPGAIIPATQTAAHHYPSPMQDIDILPTLLESAGLSHQGMDGRSHWSAIKGGTKLPARPMFWQTSTPLGYDYAVLSADGLWLRSSTWGQDTTDWLARAGIGVESGHNRSSEPQRASLKAALDEEYFQWVPQTRTLNLHAERTSRQTLEIRQQGIQRTPGTAAVNIALSLRGNWENHNKPLITQENWWSMKTSEGQIQVDWQNIHLSAPAAFTTTCQSIVVAFEAEQRGIINNHVSVAATLYIDGKRVAGQRLDDVAQIPKEFPPTIIHASAKKKGKKPGINHWLIRNDKLFDDNNPRNTQVRDVVNQVCRE